MTPTSGCMANAWFSQCLHRDRADLPGVSFVVCLPKMLFLALMSEGTDPCHRSFLFTPLTSESMQPDSVSIITAESAVLKGRCLLQSYKSSSCPGKGYNSLFWGVFTKVRLCNYLFSYVKFPCVLTIMLKNTSWSINTTRFEKLNVKNYKNIFCTWQDSKINRNFLTEHVCNKTYIQATLSCWFTKKY